MNQCICFIKINYNSNTFNLFCFHKLTIFRSFFCSEKNISKNENEKINYTKKNKKIYKNNLGKYPEN